LDRGHPGLTVHAIGQKLPFLRVSGEPGSTLAGTCPISLLSLLSGMSPEFQLDNASCSLTMTMQVVMGNLLNSDKAP
jgi:hypothetical protein